MFNSSEMLRIAVGNSSLDQRIVRGTSIFFSEFLRDKEPFFVGGDNLFYLSEVERSGCRGFSMISRNYFGLDFGSPENMLDFILYLVASRSYATRSKLTQPGLSVQFEGIGFDNDGNIILETNITSLTGRQLVNIPKSFPLF